MDNKYYTPEIEEFHVGFEYEIFEDFDTLPERVWHKQVYGKNGTDPEQMDYVTPIQSMMSKFRVKFLDQEDIENCGWEPVKYNTVDCWVLNNNYLFWFGLTVVIINKPESQVFRGTIKNKSELKKLMQQLNIKRND